MNIGTNIRKYRILSGLTQKELAEKVGLGQSMLSQIEQNRADTTVSNIIKIAQVLKCRVINLLDGVDETENCSENKGESECKMA